MGLSINGEQLTAESSGVHHFWTHPNLSIICDIEVNSFRRSSVGTSESPVVDNYSPQLLHKKMPTNQVHKSERSRTAIVGHIARIYMDIPTNPLSEQ